MSAGEGREEDGAPLAAQADGGTSAARRWLIWLVSILISLPEVIILTSVGFLNDKDKFPCITENIHWDLSTCEPSWGKDQVFIYTVIKVK